MSWTGSARDEILLSIRRQLHGVRGSGARPAVAVGSRSPGAPENLADPAARVARFRELLESVGGRTYAARDEKEATASLEGIVERAGAREIALSDSPLARRLAARLGPRVKTFGRLRERRRSQSDLGISGAQWGIAEMGTPRPRFQRGEAPARLACAAHPRRAILETRTILMTLGDAFAAARARPAIPPDPHVRHGPIAHRRHRAHSSSECTAHEAAYQSLLLEGPRP
jgi:L-lactate utilization protein LutC